MVNFIKKYFGYIIYFILWFLFYQIFRDSYNFMLVYRMGYSKMVGISVGVFTIVIFVNDFFKDKSVDLTDKTNYYLGYNIRYYDLYENSIFKISKNTRLEMLLSIMLIIPSLLILTRFTYNICFLKYLFDFIRSINKFLMSAWCSLLSLSGVYLIFILYSILKVTRKIFYDGYKLNVDIFGNYKNKKEIEEHISIIYGDKFKSIFEKRNTISEVDLNVIMQVFTKDIFNIGKSVSNDKDEFGVFIRSAYYYEKSIIQDLINGNKTDDKIIKLISDYYISKWQKYIWIPNVCICPSAVMEIAMNDLNTINYIYKMCGNSVAFDNSFKKRTDIEWNNKKNKTSNKVISEIVQIIGISFSDDLFIKNSYYATDIYRIFDILSDLRKHECISKKDLGAYIEYLLDNLYFRGKDVDVKVKVKIKDFESCVSHSDNETLKDAIKKYRVAKD